MAPILPSFAGLSSDQLLTEVLRLASDERHATAALVAALAEMDERKLHVREGYPSLFAYCTGRLHLSEPATCRRIDAARASRRFPLILERLAEGSLTLAAVGLLAKLLTPENHVAVLDGARHRSKRELEELVGRLSPRPDLPTSVRKLPAPRESRIDAGECGQASVEGPAEPPSAASLSSSSTASQGSPMESLLDISAGSAESAAGSPTSLASAGTVVAARAPAPRPAVIRPLAPSRYQVTVTVSAETHAKLLHARDLLRHSIPSGDAALVIDRALTVLLAQLEKAKFAAETPRAANVTAADGGQRPERRRRGSAKRRRFNSASGKASRPANDAQSGAPGEPVRDGATSSPEEVGAVTETTSSSAPQPQSAARAPAPPHRSRYIAASVRREVWARSGGRCEFVSEYGHRCESRSRLEFHHRVAFAAGGVSSVTNLLVYCVSHNQLEAESFFGARHVAARQAAGDGRCERGNSDPRGRITVAGDGKVLPGSRRAG